MINNYKKDLRQNSTDVERLLWRHLRNRQLDDAKFRRQVLIGKYIVDFVCFEARLIIELDGGQHNNNLNDLKRTYWLEQQRFRVIRFWNNEVLKNLYEVKEAILRELKNTPHPSPLPQGERGRID